MWLLTWLQQRFAGLLELLDVLLTPLRNLVYNIFQWLFNTETSAVNRANFFTDFLTTVKDNAARAFTQILHNIALLFTSQSVGTEAGQRSVEDIKINLKQQADKFELLTNIASSKAELKADIAFEKEKSERALIEEQKERKREGEFIKREIKENRGAFDAYVGFSMPTLQMLITNPLGYFAAVLEEVLLPLLTWLLARGLTSPDEDIGERPF